MRGGAPQVARHRRAPKNLGKLCRGCAETIEDLAPGPLSETIKIARPRRGYPKSRPLPWEMWGAWGWGCCCCCGFLIHVHIHTNNHTPQLRATGTWTKEQASGAGMPLVRVKFKLGRTILGPFAKPHPATATMETVVKIAIDLSEEPLLLG